MKKIIIKLLLICCFSATTLAVNAIDLKINNASISPNPLVANTPYVISATFENFSGASSPQDAQLVVVSITGFNSTNIDIASPIAANPTGWGCAYDATFNSIDCLKIFNTGDFSPGTTQNFSVQINPGSTVVNPDNFHIEMIDDILGDETFPNQIDVPVGGNPDYQLQVLSPNPLAINPAPGADPISFQLDLLGANGSSSFEIVDIIVPAGFTLGNVAMANGAGFTGNATWSCVVNTAPNWQCFNTVTTGGMNLGDSAIISADILNRPSVAGGPHPFDVSIFNPSTGATNTATLNVNINNPPPSGNLIIDNSGSNPNPTPISETFHHAITLPKPIHYRVTNIGGLINKPVGNPTPTVELSIAFNPGFSVSMPNPPSGTGTWSCSPPTSSPINCILTDNTYAANAFTDFVFDVSPLNTTPAGTYNAPGLDATLTGFGIATPATFSTSLIVINPDVSISKTLTLVNGSAPVGSPVNVQNGDTVTYKILAVNNTPNSSAANNITFTDTLPAGLINPTIVSGLGNFIGNCSFTGTTLSCNNSATGLLPHDSTGTAQDGVEFTAEVAGNTGDSILNQVQLSSVQFDSTANSLVPADKTLSIIAPTVLGVSITKTASSPTYMVGDNVVYTILVENTTATLSVLDMEINDVLPIANLDAATVSVNATTLVGSSTYSCSFDAVDTVSCANTSALPFVVGDKLEVVISVDASTAGTNISNIATATSSLLGSLGSSLPAVISINSGNPIIQPTSISVQKSVSQNGVQVSEIEKGSSFQYEVVVTNTGNSGLYSFSVIDSMPQGVVVDNIVTPVGMTCNNQGQTYSCNYPQPLATNSSLQIIYQVTDASDANTTSLLNTVRVVSFNAQEKSDEALVILTGSNPNPNPNSNYTLEIKDDVDPVQQGEDFNYTVTLKNTGSVALNAIDINLMLPPELQVNSTQTNGVSCSTVSTGLHCIASGGLVVNAGQQLDILTVNVVSNDFFGDVLAQVIANNTGSTSISADETTTILEHIIIPKTDLSVTVGNTQIANQGGQTNFDVRVENLAAPAIKPRLQVSLSGLIDATQVSANEFWDCDVAGVNVTCVYRGASMPSGQVTSIQFNLVLTQISVEAENIVVVASIESDTEDEFIANNTTTATINVNPTPTEGEILSALRSALDGKANQQVNRAIQNVASYCEVSYFMALEGMCEDLYQSALSGDGETINTVMEQITPNEVIGQSTSIAEIATAQFRNIGSRLSQLRAGGGSGFSSAGLNATYGNGSLPLGMLAYLNKSVDESSNIDVNNDFISPWGFFVNGTISMGTRDATGRELGFDFDSYGLTAGVDYRLSANKVVGVALGYANFDSDIDGQAKLKSTGVTLTGYGSFYVNDNFYVDARISVAKPDFDQSRKIEFTLGDTTISRVASGSTSSNQYSVAMSAGYNFYKNSWNITPNGSFRYIKTAIDGFTETGAGGFNFNYSNQDIESMIWSAGIRVSKAISLKNGVITPQFDFDYNYQSLNDGNDIEARFVAAPLSEVFIIETDSPDRTYGSAGLGFAYISSNGKQAYINYRSVLGLEGFSRGTFNLGARFEF